MHNWLRTAWGFIRGLPKDTSRYLHKIISAVIGWATNIFHIVGSAWDELAKAYHDLAHSVGSFMDSTFAHIAKIVTHTIPELAKAIAHDIAKVATDVADLARTAAKWVSDAVKYAEKLVSDALKWVRDNVLDPLSKDIASIVHWIDNTGKEIWNDLHDGSFIAGVILPWFGRHLMDVLKQYLATVMRWILGNGVTFGTSLARIVEDALTEVL